MNRVTMVILLVVVVMLAGLLTASETAVKGRIYSHWFYNTSDINDGANEFVLGRTYITIKSKLSEYTSAQITSDLKKTAFGDDAKERYSLMFKYVFIDWSPAFTNHKVKLRIGLQPMSYSGYIDGYRGRRYLILNAADKNHFLTTADAGVSAIYAIGEDGKCGTLQAGFFNGTSYTDLEEKNEYKSIHLFTHLKPLVDNDNFSKSALGAQFFKGTQNRAFELTDMKDDYKKDVLSMSAVVAYRDLFNVGVDMGWHTTGQGAGVAENKESVVSMFGTLYLGEIIQDVDFLRTLNLFSRFDTYDPNDDADDDAEKFMMVGVECNPTKGFKASFNYRSTSFDNDDPDESFLFFNTLYKF